MLGMQDDIVIGKRAYHTMVRSCGYLTAIACRKICAEKKSLLRRLVSGLGVKCRAKGASECCKIAGRGRDRL